MEERRADFVFGLVVAAFGLGALALGELTIGEGFAEDAVGPRTFPRILSVAIMLGGLAVARRAWSRPIEWEAADDGGTSDDAGDPGSARRAFTLMGLTIGYAALLAPLGFVLSTPLYMAAAMWLLRLRSWLLLTVVPIVFTLLFFVVFVRVLRVPLPTGITTDFFRAIGFVR
jgi:putative tricarboxylic transport membrane protein